MDASHNKYLYMFYVVYNIYSMYNRYVCWLYNCRCCSRDCARGYTRIVMLHHSVPVSDHVRRCLWRFTSALCARVSPHMHKPKYHQQHSYCGVVAAPPSMAKNTPSLLQRYHMNNICINTVYTIFFNRRKYHLLYDGLRLSFMNSSPE